MTKIGDAGKGSGDDGHDKMTILPSSPLFLHPSDSPSLKLTQTMFNGENYDLWADAVRNGLDAKNKLGFVDGTITKPTDENSYEGVAWRQCNAMVKAWLRSVIDEKLHPSITFSKCHLLMKSKELKERYSANASSSSTQKLNRQSVNRRLGQLLSTIPISNQFGMNWLNTIVYPISTCGAKAAFVKEKEEEKVHQFIMGLNICVV
ncbi:uncharacterized protein LOC141630275 [Silene latifolia]|uniref:uncharacterized protein LOC141630275 n=1 Tax=Silene latifolia TaxID=37657 RepID=UPI003D771908